MQTIKKITRTTVKKFIRENAANLWINVTSEFDGMTDGCEQRHEGFTRVTAFTAADAAWSMGIKGAWFVGDSRDYFESYSKNGFQGIRVSNSCGRFILAIKSVTL